MHYRNYNGVCSAGWLSRKTSTWRENMKGSACGHGGGMGVEGPQAIYEASGHPRTHLPPAPGHSLAANKLARPRPPTLVTHSPPRSPPVPLQTDQSPINAVAPSPVPPLPPPPDTTPAQLVHPGHPPAHPGIFTSDDAWIPPAWLPPGGPCRQPPSPPCCMDRVAVDNKRRRRQGAWRNVWCGECSPLLVGKFRPGRCRGRWVNRPGGWCMERGLHE